MTIAEIMERDLAEARPAGAEELAERDEAEAMRVAQEDRRVLISCAVIFAVCGAVAVVRLLLTR